MPARRCDICSINYPPDTAKPCDVCGTGLNYHSDLDPDPDWRAEVEHRKTLPRARDGEGQRVEAWRLQQALELGVPVEDAERFAVSRADLHDLDELIRVRGCPPVVAVDILV